MMAQDQTAEFFDRYAQGFSAIYGTDNGLFNRVVNRFFRQSMKERYLSTLEGCHPIKDKSVLDVGCGPGHYSVELARRGAGRVLGLDFADGMLSIAREQAQRAGVSGVCTFERGDFLERQFSEKFDYVILMGFMDYMKDPGAVVRKALSVTGSKAFFSFPLDGGFLAWQRSVRYKMKCDLYLYNESRVRSLFDGLSGVRIETKNLKRDLFVTAYVG